MVIKVSGYTIIVNNFEKKNIKIPKEFLKLESIIDVGNPRERMLNRYSQYVKTVDKQPQKIVKLLKKKKEIIISCGCNNPFKCHGNIIADRVVELIRGQKNV
jgi:hypothetical protein